MRLRGRDEQISRGAKKWPWKFVTTWICLGDMMLHEQSGHRKTNTTLSHLCVKSKVAESNMVVARDWGKGENMEVNG